MSIAVMSEMFAIPFGNATRKMVAIRLADFADDQGRGIWPSVDTLAEQCELSPRTVQRVLGEFVDEGILVKRQQGGGRKTSRYDFDLAIVRARKQQKQPVDTPKNLTAHEGCQGVTGDTDDARGDTVSPLGCHGVTRTVNEPSITIKERESAGARPIDDGKEKLDQTGQATAPDDQPTVEEGSEAQPDPKTVPGTAGFERRVRNLCTGYSFNAGPWPDWDTGKSATLSWIEKQFANLDESERMVCERGRDAYLFDIKQRKAKPVAIGVFIKEKRFADLDPALLAKAQAAAGKGAKPGEVPKPDGWAVAWGPVWNAYVLKTLLGVRADGGTDVPLLRADIANAWPVLTQLQSVAAARHGSVMKEAVHGLREHMEPVPLGSDRAAYWRDVFKAYGWPWLAELDRRDVVYMPKDLAAFCEVAGLAMPSGLACAPLAADAAAAVDAAQPRDGAPDPMRGGLPSAGDKSTNGEGQ